MPLLRELGRILVVCGEVHLGVLVTYLGGLFDLGIFFYVDTHIIG